MTYSHEFGRDCQGFFHAYTFYVNLINRKMPWLPTQEFLFNNLIRLERGPQPGSDFWVLCPPSQSRNWLKQSTGGKVMSSCPSCCCPAAPPAPSIIPFGAFRMQGRGGGLESLPLFSPHCPPPQLAPTVHTSPRSTTNTSLPAASQQAYDPQFEKCCISLLFAMQSILFNPLNF